MTDKELHLLIHPEQWPYPGQLPVIRRGGAPVLHGKDAGIVTNGNLCRVWVGVLLGDDPFHGTLVQYPTPEALLADWAID